MLPEDVLIRLAHVGSTRTYSDEDVIFRYSDPGEEMYIIEEGHVGLIFEEGKAGKLLSRGSFFGELALFDRSRLRTATAVAACECRLRILGQGAFDELLGSHSALLATLLIRTCSYLVESEQGLITDLQKRNRELEQTLDYLRRTRQELDSAELLSQTDVLTGLYNRRCLDQQIEVLLPRANERAAGLAFLIADIDHFKSINDTHGHHVGDVVLKRFADVLRKSIRQSDLPCRLGGDEFAVVFSGIVEDKVMAMVTQVFTAVGALDVSLPHTELHVTASMGGTVYRIGESWDSFFKRADKNLYIAKKGGRHRLGWAGKTMTL